MPVQPSSSAPSKAGPLEDGLLRTFTINDRRLQAEEGTTLLEAALEAGIKIPTLCYHKELTPYGACRLCLVEIVDGARPGIQTACLYKVIDGLVVRTDTERVMSTRSVIFELLLARSPDSEKVKKLAAEYGVTETRIELDCEGTCILCGLCVRACAEISQRHAIVVAYKGSKKKVRTPFGKISERCIGCGSCAYVCPTGSIEVEQAD